MVVRTEKVCPFKAAAAVEEKEKLLGGEKEQNVRGFSYVAESVRYVGVSRETIREVKQGVKR